MADSGSKYGKTLEQEAGTIYGVPGLGGLMSLDDGVKMVICMAGFTGCGKTYVAHKIRRFFTWKGYKAKVFSVADVIKQIYPEFTSPNPEFFSDNIKKYANIRDEMVDSSLQSLFEYLRGEGQVGILDGANIRASTRERINIAVKNEPNVHVPLWIEMNLKNEELVRDRFRREKLLSIEYMGYDFEKAMSDHMQRLKYQQDCYESLALDCSSYCIVEVNSSNQSRRRIRINNVRGYLTNMTVSFVMNLFPVPEPIYFSRHGQSVYNIEDRIGGDSSLSPAGWEYAQKLGKYVNERADMRGVTIWTSQLKRTVQTGQFIESGHKVQWAALNEIDTGMCENMTYGEIKEHHEDIHRQRRADKLRFRYPQGESYLDVIERLQPVILELERTFKPVLVIAHQAVLRCLISYFLDKRREDIPYLPISSHSLIRIIPHESSYDEERIPLSPLFAEKIDRSMFRDIASVKRKSSIK